jgi:hypothetical protein
VPLPPRPLASVLERIQDRCKVDTASGCLLWQGSRNSSGYGTISIGGRRGTDQVHRIVYAHAHGPIPQNLEIMHLCHTRLCVNPDHLRLGTRAENIRMSQIAGRLKRR